MRGLLVALVLVFGVPAGLAPAQAAGCDHITNAFAYNECLSKQSAPRARSVPRGRGGDPEATVQESGSRGGRRARGGYRDANGVMMSRSGGRVRATIDPWSGMRG